MSKLTRDEIPRENYDNLNKVLASLDPANQAEPPEKWYDGEEWLRDEGGNDDWSNSREKSTSGHQYFSDEDDIQV